MWRNKDYLALAKGKPCICCGNVGTTVSAHYSGIDFDRLGKGQGIKSDDIFVAHLCDNCHQYMDVYSNGNTIERSQLFMLYILQTIKRLLETGEIEIKVNK